MEQLIIFTVIFQFATNYRRVKIPLHHHLITIKPPFSHGFPMDFLQPDGSKARIDLLQPHLLLLGSARCLRLGGHGLQLVPGGIAHRVQGGDVGHGVEIGGEALYFLVIYGDLW